MKGLLLQQCHEWGVESIEPNHWLAAMIGVIVPAKSRIQYQVAFRHHALLPFDGRERAGAFYNEAERHYHVPMRRRVLAGIHRLQTQLNRVGRNASAVFDPRVN